MAAVAPLTPAERDLLTKQRPVITTVMVMAIMHLVVFKAQNLIGKRQVQICTKALMYAEIYVHTHL